MPDSQLSLAIGKKGQNARLAAKLTGLRVGVKSEAEVAEERRRQEDERTRGLAAFDEIEAIGPGLVPRLVEQGLYSPGRIRAAGLDRLRAALSDDAPMAEAVMAGAEAWLSAQAEADAAAAAAVAHANEEAPAEPGAVESTDR